MQWSVVFWGEPSSEPWSEQVFFFLSMRAKCYFSSVKKTHYWPTDTLKWIFISYYYIFCNPNLIIFLEIFGGHRSFCWDHWYPCSRLLMMSALCFKTRVDPHLHTSSAVCNVLFRFTSDSTPLDGQHSNQAFLLHVILHIHAFVWLELGIKCTAHCALWPSELVTHCFPHRISDTFKMRNLRRGSPVYCDFW